MDNENAPKFSSIKSISNLVVIFLIISIATSVIYSISALVEINLLSALDKGITVNEDEIYANDLRVGIIGGLYIIIGIVAMILFFIWFYKAYKNLPALGAKELSFSSRWVVAYFFIPILWFYKPYSATKEIWKSSESGTSETDKSTRKQMNTAGLIKIWWAFWIISGIIGWFYLRSFPAMMNVETISGFIALNYMDVVTEIPIVISNILTLLLVRKINSYQENKSQSFVH